MLRGSNWMPQLVLYLETSCAMQILQQKQWLGICCGRFIIWEMRVFFRFPFSFLTFSNSTTSSNMCRLRNILGITSRIPAQPKIRIFFFFFLVFIFNGKSLRFSCKQSLSPLLSPQEVKIVRDHLKEW